METLTTTIRQEPLRQIVARTKTTEYREIKPYWTRRFQAIECPFLLRLINGMRPKAPEATVVIRRVRKNRRTGYYELHIGAVREVRNWRRGDVGRRR